MSPLTVFEFSVVRCNEGLGVGPLMTKTTSEASLDRRGLSVECVDVERLNTWNPTDASGVRLDRGGDYHADTET